MRNIEHYEQEEIQEVNPWKTIWYSPRAAIRSVIEFKPTSFAIILAAIVGMTEIFDKAISEELGETMAMPLILLIALIGGAISGVIGLVVTAGLSTLIGKLFGGVARFKEMFMAIGAAYIPAALSIVIYVIDLLILGEKLFIDVDISVFQALWLVFSAFLTVVLSIWMLFLTIKAIAVAHRFSFWKGLFTYIIPSIAIFLLLIGFIFMIFLFF